MKEIRTVQEIYIDGKLIKTIETITKIQTTTNTLPKQRIRAGRLFTRSVRGIYKQSGICYGFVTLYGRTVEVMQNRTGVWVKV